MLEPDPLKRLSMQEVKEHPWVTKLATKVPVIFTRHELEIIERDFTYKEVCASKKRPTEEVSINKGLEIYDTTHNENHPTLPLFTEHELDEEYGGGGGHTSSLHLEDFGHLRPDAPQRQ
jgi:hypothetical protein